MSIFWQNFFQVPFLKIEGFIGLLSLGFEGQWGFFLLCDEMMRPISLHQDPKDNKASILRPQTSYEAI
jgi:hypothetical protein